MQDAAAQLGLEPSTVEHGVRLTLVRERRSVYRQAAELLSQVEFDDVALADVDDDREHRKPNFNSSVKAAVSSLRDSTTIRLGLNPRRGTPVCACPAPGPDRRCVPGSQRMRESCPIGRLDIRRPVMTCVARVTNLDYMTTQVIN